MQPWGLAFLGTEFPKMEVVNIEGSVDEKTIVAVLKSCKNLKTLITSENANFGNFFYFWSTKVNAI